MLAAVLKVKWEPKKEYNLSEFENNNKKARAGGEVWSFCGICSH